MESNAAEIRAKPPLHVERLDLLQRLVACHTENGEWETFIALLQRIGADVFSEGVRYVR